MNDILFETRKELVSKIQKELLGPGSEYSIPNEDNELITDLPEVRYSVGILFPQKNLINADNNEVPTKINGHDTDHYNETNQEEKIDEDNDSQKQYRGNVGEEPNIGTLDEDIGLSMQNMPSSMGYTFFINSNIDELIFDISFATYRKATVEDCKLPFNPDNAEQYVLPIKVVHLVESSKELGLLVLKNPLKRKDVYQILENEEVNDVYLIDSLYRLSNQFEKGFVREPHNFTIKLAFTDEKSFYEEPNLNDQNIKLVVLRKRAEEGINAITAMLVNTNSGGYNGTNSFFQPMIVVDTEKNPNIIFHAYSKRYYSQKQDSEEKSLDLLYRDKKVYATGHGVSADWKITESDNGKVWTEFVPVYEVPQMDFNISGLDTNVLSMKYLSDIDSTEKLDKLNSMKKLVDAYAAWIVQIGQKGKTLDERYQEAVKKHIHDCEESLQRMYVGLELLKDDVKVFNAFQLANRSMFMQRIHANFQKEDHYPDDQHLQERMSQLNYYLEDDSTHRWRPFQLAFLLMSLKSITNETSDERDLVDLIWFPTGGGKTEAYLGLTAFTIFYRRLAHLETSKGTTVIMRYTLRLLAAQQFLRAGTLICACESIRKDSMKRKSKYPSYQLGTEKITIGLWIGGTHTPNKNDKAKELVNKLHKATSSDIREVKDINNRFQILKCPWCGTKLVKDQDSSGKSLVGQWGYSMRDKNHFQINCTQENCEFESVLPIQVVDEELYINPPTLLFGTVDKFAMLPWKNDIGSFFATSDENRTPELIIQDELHLISGPLGTMVGLYETAIDALCSAKGIKPKIIASTATIRRAKDQCSNLFNRDVRQFPAPGIDSTDSFFAREANIQDKPGRLYVGFMPSGKTKAMMEVRSIAAILQRVHMMEIPYHIKDKFWTLAVYFNSLRDLSKCMTLVDDDVKDFLRRTAQRFGKRNLTRPLGSAHELTSRISTSQLNETLEKLEQLVYSEENQRDKKYPINVLLATNMLSVGVDVARLNVMLLVGQPKLTSEYIQASSRIGRTYPGVAFVLYDGAKSRDRSHYEQFNGYHQSFYKFVEPTGVTPFAKPARDRALHAVMVTLMRHKFGLSQDKDAALFQKDADGVKEIQQFITQRMSEIRDRVDIELQDENNEVIQEMKDFWDEWEDRISRGSNNFFYGDRFIVTDPPTDSKRLLKVYGNESSDNAKETLTSMRNVDKNVIAGLIIWE
ncbi:helicase [Bacillus canaveralius]|uniref:Helicase n=1 Tax=Bacillus canaveralius TaxID=1403243 RepID=A0A2N5GJX7_9BACI|nr:helicase-related protein [Bacillus canaveralius]PLR81625.1 helicase [Bacillus canaveralius]PLR89912.1 helicase [Bacillus canaveralius]